MSFGSSKFLSVDEDTRLKTLFVNEKNRNTLALELLRTYGMRSSELLLLTPKSINRESKSLFVKGTKKSSDRELPLNEELLERLEAECIGCLNENTRIFNFSRQRLFEIWHYYRELIYPYGPSSKKKLHSLRHTVGIELYKRTRDIRLVQKFLGHKSIANTMIYLDFVYTQEEFRKAMVVPLKSVKTGTGRSCALKPGANPQRSRNYE